MEHPRITAVVLFIMFTTMASSVSSFTPRIYKASRLLRKRPVSASTARDSVSSLTNDAKPTVQPKNPPDDGKVLGKFPFGPTISNKERVFDEIDRALGVKKPPDIEVILTDHLANLNNTVSKFLHLNVMRFGHIAIRYRTSDGKQRVMNIMGNFTDPDSTLINFFEPSDYFYGTDPKIAQQGGVYSRPFVGVRIENVAPGATDALHAYYQAVSKASEIGSATTTHAVAGTPGSSKRGAARFQLVEVQFSRLARYLPAPIDKILFKVADWIREQDDRRRETMLKASQNLESFMKEQDNRFMDGMVSDMIEDTSHNMIDVRRSLYQSGNCAQWTSAGLEFCGLIRRSRLFPKAILIDLLEDEYLTNRQPDNVHVVYYDEVEDAPQFYDNYKCIKSAMVSPLKVVRNDFYLNMKEFASCVVTVPSGTDKAVVQAQKPTAVPQKWPQYLSLVTIYAPAAVLTGLVTSIGPLGPSAATAWLGANWWLY